MGDSVEYIFDNRVNGRIDFYKLMGLRDELRQWFELPDSTLSPQSTEHPIDKARVGCSREQYNNLGHKIIIHYYGQRRPDENRLEEEKRFEGMYDPDEEHISCIRVVMERPFEEDVEFLDSKVRKYGLPEPRREEKVVTKILRAIKQK